jgi:hypothetical protein
MIGSIIAPFAKSEFALKLICRADFSIDVEVIDNELVAQLTIVAEGSPLSFHEPCNTLNVRLTSDRYYEG